MRILNSQKLIHVVLAFALSAPAPLFADFSYDQTTQITGGSIVTMMKMAGAFSSQARKAGEPIVSSIYLKGNRMAHVSPDHIEIIDLDNETITNIDPAKHTYTVMTFQQMKDQMEKAHQEMEKKQAERTATPPPADSNPDVKMSFDVQVRKTGASKQVSGLDTSEAIMTLMMNATDQKSQQTGSMAITNDMWLVPEIPGYSEVRDFYVRMAKKMDIMNSGFGMDMSRLFAQSPGAAPALSDMAKEMQKLQGVPVLQIMRMGSTADGKPLPAASEAPLPASNSPAMPSGSEIAKESATSVLTSHIPFGGFGHKKQQPDPPPPPAKTDQSASPTAAVLMELQTTSSNFSSASVDPSHFDVPAGFKQVQPQIDRQGHQ